MRIALTWIILILVLSVSALYIGIFDPVVSHLYKQAIKENDLVRLKRLTQFTPAIDVKDDNGDTPLFEASYKNNLEAARLLVESGANIESVGHDGATALHEAAVWGSNDVLSFLLDKGANINAAGKYGTPLHYSATYCNAKTAKLLIKSGAKLRIPDDEGLFFFHKAARCREIVTLLLSKGNDINIKTKDGRTPLHEYAKDLGMSQGADLTLFFINNGARLNETDSTGRTPLHFAVLGGSLDKAKVLVAKGAEHNLRDKQGHTAFFAAVLAEDIELAKFFVGLGVNINETDNDGNTVLNKLLLGCHDNEIFSYLLENNIDVSLKNNNSKGALHSLVSSDCGNRSSDEMIAILKKGGSLDEEGSSTNSPFKLLVDECKAEKYGAAFLLIDFLNFKYTNSNDIAQAAKKINCKELFDYL